MYNVKYKNIFNYSLVALFVFGVMISSLLVVSVVGFVDKKFFSLNVFAPKFSNSITNASNDSIVYYNNSNIKSSTQDQDVPKTVTASGHFANNQMKDRIVTWIQGGFWNLQIDNSSKTNRENINANAIFDANFTMIRPDGSLSHSHVINNFTSTNVIFAGNDIVITGISDINSNNGTEYEEVPITVHLMGKKVLGLMIDVNKTGGHFSGSNEMFGTLISGIGLDNSTSTINNTANDRMSVESNNITSTNSMAHTGH